MHQKEGPNEARKKRRGSWGPIGFICEFVSSSFSFWFLFSWRLGACIDYFPLRWLKGAPPGTNWHPSSFEQKKPLVLGLSYLLRFFDEASPVKTTMKHAIARHFKVHGLFCCVVQMLVYIFAFGFALVSCGKFQRELGHWVCMSLMDPYQRLFLFDLFCLVLLLKLTLFVL